MRLGRLAIAVASMAAGAACSLLTPLDDLGGTGDASTDAVPTDGSGDVAACKADLTSDPMNCGTCGHDCCGGACVGGVCQPRVLATQQENVSYVRADDKYAFWTVGANDTLKPTDLMRVQLDGTGLTKMVNGRAIIHAYSTDAAHLYWMEFIPYAFYIASAAKDGVVVNDAGVPFTKIPAIDLSASSAFASFMFVDSTDAYWIAGSKPECKSPYCLYRAPIANVLAGAGGYQVVAPTNLAFAGGFGQDADFFYVWVSGNTIVRSRKAGGVDGGSNVEAIVSGLPNISGMTVNSTRVFWSDTPAATIYSASKVPGGADAAANEVFSTLQNEPTGLEADDDDVYWANSDGIVTCPTKGCPNGKDKPRVLVKESGIVSFTLTKKCFVWANRKTATVNVVGR